MAAGAAGAIRGVQPRARPGDEFWLSDARGEGGKYLDEFAVDGEVDVHA